MMLRGPDVNEDMSRWMGFEVQALQPGGSAQRSGKVKVRDVLTHVDGVEIVHHNKDDVSRRIAGREGTEVALTLLRNMATRTHT